MKRKINIDRPELSSEEIASKANFNNVLNNMTGTASSGINGSWIAGSLMVGVILGALGWIGKQEKDLNVPNSSTNVVQTSASKSPNTMGVPETTSTINIDETTVITTPRGTEITIPSGSIVDADGNPVSGPIDIVYREWFDPVEAALDDIPMEYDSAGHNYIFETAGMIEIHGYKNGEPVFINPQKPINITMRSPVRGKEYNLYSLDTTTQDWTFLGKPGYSETPSALDLADQYREEFPDELQQLEADWTNQKQKVEKIKASAPQQPRRYNRTLYHFDLDVDKSDFPELAAFQNITFEVDPQEDVDKSIYDTEWDDAELSASTESVSNQSDMYLLTLRKGRKTKQFNVYPVLRGEDFDHAMEVYHQELNTHKARVERAEVDEAKLRSEFETKLTVWKSEAMKERENARTMAEEVEHQKQLRSQQNNSSARTVIREITIDAFGTYNCDKPYSPPRKNKRDGKVAFKNTKTGSILKFGALFLIEAGRRAFQRFTLRDISGINWNPEENNVMFGITNDGRVAKYTPGPGETIPKDAAYYVFNMDVSEKTFASPKEVKAYLGLKFDE